MRDVKPKRLAVVKNRALGDAVITLGTLNYLKKILPDTQLFYFVPSWTKDLFKEVSIGATAVGFKMNSPGDWWGTFQLLKQHKIDCILELSQAGRTGTFFSLYSQLFNVPYFYHNHHQKLGPIRDQGVQKAIIQRDLDAAWTYFGKNQKSPVPNYLEFPPVLGLYPPAKEKRVVLGVVATRETKMYPLAKYNELAQFIRAHDPEFQVVAPLSSSPGDQKIAQQLSEMKSPILVMKLGLKDLPHYFKSSSIYIGNDTGLKHIAAAVDIPTLTLFGPEPPLEWHPYDKNNHQYFFKNPLPCRYETGKTYCPLSKCGSMICLKDFTPREVWEKAQSLLFKVP